MFLETLLFSNVYVVCPVVRLINVFYIWELIFRFVELIQINYRVKVMIGQEIKLDHIFVTLQ